jgi:hypothetical protein
VSVWLEADQEGSVGRSRSGLIVSKSTLVCQVVILLFLWLLGCGLHNGQCIRQRRVLRRVVADSYRIGWWCDVCYADVGVGVSCRGGGWMGASVCVHGP